MFNNSANGKIVNLGVFSSISEFINLRYQSGNISFSKMLNDYGDLNMNQLNCLNCRSTVYVVGTVIANELGIKYIAEGARKTQMFVIEQNELINGYKSLLANYKINLLLPVYDYEEDADVENELLRVSSNLFGKILENTISYEEKCLLGMPMNQKLTQKEINSYGRFYEKVLKLKMIEDIDSYSTYSIKEQVKK